MTKTSAHFTRAECNTIFVDYVDTYLHTIVTGQYSASTVMFVCKQVEGGDGRPVVIPREIEDFGDKTLKLAVKTAVIESDNLLLDMILYCKISPLDKNGEVSVWFGCRDARGNTLHRSYKVEKSLRQVTPLKMFPFFNVWLPPVGKKTKIERFRDPVLVQLATNWALFYSEYLHKR